MVRRGLFLGCAVAHDEDSVATALGLFRPFGELVPAALEVKIDGQRIFHAHLLSALLAGRPCSGGRGGDHAAGLVGKQFVDVYKRQVVHYKYRAIILYSKFFRNFKKRKWLRVLMDRGVFVTCLLYTSEMWKDLTDCKPQ